MPDGESYQNFRGKSTTAFSAKCMKVRDSNPPVTATPVGKGAGPGLSTAYDIMTLHNGNRMVENEVAGETTFHNQNSSPDITEVHCCRKSEGIS